MKRDQLLIDKDNDRLISFYRYPNGQQEIRLQQRFPTGESRFTLTFEEGEYSLETEQLSDENKSIRTKIDFRDTETGTITNASVGITNYDG